MPAKEFDDARHLIGQMSLDLGVSGGAIGRVLREQISIELRNRVRMNGGKSSDVTVDMAGDNAATISVHVRDELGDAQKVAIRNAFAKVMTDLGAVEAGKSMAGEPTAGLRDMLKRGGIS